MNNPYSDALKDYEQSSGKRFVDTDGFLKALQAALERAYQDGYEAAILHLEKEYKNHE